MAEKTRSPAHRPSRRQEIVDAAIRQFADNGFVDTAISDIAEEAGVAVTAVYYHFDGKDDLFAAALNEVFASISETVAEVRAAHPEGDRTTLEAVIDAVWAWIDDNPDGATLLYVQFPGVNRSGALRSEMFKDRHAAQAFGYFGVEDASALSATERAAITLRARAMVAFCISVHSMRLADGPLGALPDDVIRSSLHDLASRLVSI